MCELLQMFLQNEKSMFLKSMQKDGTAITFGELLSNIRMVNGCQSLTAAKRIQELLLENNILKKTQNDNFYVNKDYLFESNTDLKGWSVARNIEDIPRDLREKETTFVCIDGWNALRLVYANTSRYLYEKYKNTSISFPVLWKRLDIPDNVSDVLNNTTTL